MGLACAIDLAQHGVDFIIIDDTTQSARAQPDDFYQALLDAHADLTDEQSAALNAWLVLLLAIRLAI